MPRLVPFVVSREDIMRTIWWGGTANGCTAWMMACGEGGHEEINFVTGRFRIDLGCGRWHTGIMCPSGHHHYDEEDDDG